MNTLKQRAESFENDVESCLVDKHGLLMSALNMETMRPFAKAYFKDKSIHLYPDANWDDFSDFIAYENVGMCTGAYLAAMTHKYNVKKSTDALKKAEKINFL
ncbi:MAG: hypothetical protein P9M03_00300 [Candidatus Theseobacter exili]|nr:hypothetical protein [Candidatus Theseobacter exili]